MSPNKEIDVLESRMSTAMSSFRDFMKSIDKQESDTQVITRVHDNIRVVEVNSTPFIFELDKEKEQIVIPLRGKWKLVHHQQIRDIKISEVVRVPIGSPYQTFMKTDDPSGKFVYVQFK